MNREISEISRRHDPPPPCHCLVLDMTWCLTVFCFQYYFSLSFSLPFAGVFRLRVFVFTAVSHRIWVTLAAADTQSVLAGSGHLFPSVASVKFEPTAAVFKSDQSTKRFFFLRFEFGSNSNLRVEWWSGFESGFAGHAAITGHMAQEIDHTSKTISTAAPDHDPAELAGGNTSVEGPGIGFDGFDAGQKRL